MRRRATATCFIVAVACLLVASCGGAAGPVDPTPAGLSVDNRTGGELTIVYLVGGYGPDNATYDRNGTQEIGKATTGYNSYSQPSPLENGCTVAPIVARRADGSEVARLPVGTCVGKKREEWVVR